MSQSIFSRVFTYRQRENSSPLENFLTEIFAFCIESDTEFRKDFFNQLLHTVISDKNLVVTTQKVYEGFGRPDIIITADKSILLVECKIEANERNQQLNDYASILKEVETHFQTKHIVFLTKYFEHKELNTPSVQLHLIRWLDVYKIINSTHKEVTQQLKAFLRENRMDNIKNFSLQDLLALKTIPHTISKMDELLEQFKPLFIKEFGAFSKDSSRSSRLPSSSYYNYVSFKYKDTSYFIIIGFFWWWGETIEVPYVGLAVEIPLKKPSGVELVDILKKSLNEEKGWELEDGESSLYLSATEPITNFIDGQEDDIPAMARFINEKLNQILRLKIKNTSLFLPRNNQVEL